MWSCYYDKHCEQEVKGFTKRIYQGDLTQSEDWRKIELDLRYKKLSEFQGLQAKGKQVLLVERSKMNKKGKVYSSWSLEMKDFCISGACFESTKMTRSDFNLHIKRFINDGEQEK